MSFPADIKGSMRSCILSIFWPKRDIFEFFRDNGCEGADLRVIANYKEDGLNRASMVDSMFERLSARADGGLGPFRAMLQSLTRWSHFDPYYFDTLQKLNRKEAQRNLEHLRQLQELRDAKITQERNSRERAKAQRQRAEQNLDQLRSEFLELHAGKLSPQRRGYALERILGELAKYLSVNCHIAEDMGTSEL